jgi:hypothetical protein
MNVSAAGRMNVSDASRMSVGGFGTDAVAANL